MRSYRVANERAHVADVKSFAAAFLYLLVNSHEAASSALSIDDVRLPRAPVCSHPNVPLTANPPSNDLAYVCNEALKRIGAKEVIRPPLIDQRVDQIDAPFGSIQSTWLNLQEARKRFDQLRNVIQEVVSQRQHLAESAATFRRTLLERLNPLHETIE